jgi:NADH-quinone oxidoreductase subunit J
VILLNLGPGSAAQESQWLRPISWIGPAALSIILLAELAWLLAIGWHPHAAKGVVGPVQVGVTLLGPYLLGVELASMLLLAGLVGAYHVGRIERLPKGEKL